MLRQSAMILYTYTRVHVRMHVATECEVHRGKVMFELLRRGCRRLPCAALRSRLLSCRCRLRVRPCQGLCCQLAILFQLVHFRFQCHGLCPQPRGLSAGSVALTYVCMRDGRT